MINRNNGKTMTSYHLDEHPNAYSRLCVVATLKHVNCIDRGSVVGYFSLVVVGIAICHTFIRITSGPNYQLKRGNLLRHTG